MSSLVQLQPYDEHNQKLESFVHPQDWVNPEPTGRYNLVVIGSGPAGLITAIGAAGLGAKVALVERELMGGDCLNVGCVPSKGVISAARVAATVRDASEFGVQVPDDWGVDFAAAMTRMRRLRADMAHHDSAARFQELGIDVFLGSGSFTKDGHVEVAGKKLNYKRAVICTGGRAAELPIPGLKDVDYLTNESIFSLTELPRRLIVIGGGPIGTEMAQSFARFGSQVTQIEKAPNILPREETDAALIVQKALEKDGVTFVLNASTVRVEQRGDEKIVVVEQDGQEKEIAGDQLLIGIGRTPNVDGMGLENVGVKFDTRNGIEVTDNLQTTNPKIYAAGDVCSKYKFTHAADFMARIVIGNTLFMGRGKASTLTIPWATYTSPELAHVGLGPDEAKRRGVKIDTFTQPLNGVDRAILEGDDEGFVRIHVKKGTDKIVGATIVATNAGDMISEITLAMTHGLGLKKIASTIHPYPTQGDAIRKVGDLYNRTRLTPFVRKLFQRWLSWTR
ncbi:MAG: mercuric reductase [Planctomycetota bacterium]|nr:mercuric reductase [Planctomycetota bacterium]MDA0920024.1 mercuric reductase [Planctomycetota bacterium]MDA1159129.1 mercuric reductase [Planctomycetota bacterium]